MIGKTEAIVLNKIKYSDNSVIVNFLSRDFGRFAAIIRTPKTSKTGLSKSLFLPLNILEAEVKFKDSRSIQSVTYCNRLENTDNIICDINKLTLAQFIAEVILKTIKEEESNQSVYFFIKETILNLNRNSGKISDFHILFLIQFAAHSGFEMHNNFCNGSPFFNLREGMFLPVYTSSDESLDLPESQVLAELLSRNNDLQSTNLNYATRKKMLQHFLTYYKLHIPGFGELNSFKVLQEVFST